MKLSLPPTIKERLQAALDEDAPYQVVHYNRVEGATSAAIELAKENNDILLFVIRKIKRRYEEYGVDCVAASSGAVASELRMRYRDKKVVITDCIDEKVLRELVRFGGMKVIAIKAIRGSAEKYDECRHERSKDDASNLR